MGRPKYIGIFLTPQSKRALLRTYPPVHPTVYADHVTVIYDPTDADLKKVELGEIVTIKPVAHLEDEKAQVLKVNIPSYLDRMSNRVPHITISTARGVAPVYGGELAKSRHSMIAPKGGNYTGIVDVDTRSHPVRTRMFPLAAGPKHYKIDQGDVRRKTRRDKKQELEEAKDLGFYSYTVMRVVPLSQIKLPPVWNQGRIDRIRKGLEAGKALPPISLAGKRPPYEISDGIHRTNASKEAGYTHIPAYFTEVVERPDLYEEPEKEKAKLRPGAWVKMRKPVQGYEWALVIEYVSPRHWKGVKRHLYGLVGGDANASDFIGDWMDSEFDPVREGQVPRKVRETILSNPFTNLPQKRVARQYLACAGTIPSWSVPFKDVIAPSEHAGTRPVSAWRITSNGRERSSNVTDHCSPIRVASRWLQAQGDRKHFFEVGDIILFGKWKNKRARIVSFGTDAKGNPTVEVEPIPKGRKKNKVMGLFRIWHADPEKNQPKKEAQIRTAVFFPDWDWAKVLKEITRFNQVYKQVKGWSRLRGEKAVEVLRKHERDLLHPFAYTSYLTTGLLPGLFRWVGEWWPITRTNLNKTEDDIGDAFRLIYKALDSGDNLDLLENGRAVNNVLFFLNIFSREIDWFTKQAGPEHLTYSGFKVSNPQRAPDKTLRGMLSGVDHIMAIFRKRGMEKALAKAVKDILVRKYVPSERGVGYYDSNLRRITLTDAILRPGGGRLMDRWISEVFLHEFGHHVHMTYLHPNAKKEWDAGWSPVESAREKVEQEFKITGKDRRRFFDLITRNGWDPSKAARKLKGLDKLRFTAWLRNPGVGDPLITPKYVRLTSRGKKVFDFLRDPEGSYREEMQISERGEIGEWEAKSIAQKVERFRNHILSLNWEGADMIPRALQDEIRKEDKSVDAAINALEVPSEWARTNVLEDFAETFVAFMANPAKLSDQAKFRMQRALSLSGLYGKPVMRLAERVAQIWRAKQVALGLGEASPEASGR